MTKQIKIQGKEYQISFPNVGQYLQIEAMKQSLSGGQYARLMESPTEDADYALDLIDMYAYFSVLMPEQFRKDLLPQSFAEVSMKDALPIIKAYKEEFLGWYNETKAELKKV